MAFTLPSGPPVARNFCEYDFSKPVFRGSVVVTTVISQSDQSSAPIIETQGLCIRFGRQVVLNEINLSIPRGQTVAIIGESGCGKTMLLKSLVGLLPASQGTVRFDGCDLQSLSERELTKLRRRLGSFGFEGSGFDRAEAFGSRITNERLGQEAIAAFGRDAQEGWFGTSSYLATGIATL
jgi:hypothetical protein